MKTTVKCNVKQCLFNINDGECGRDLVHLEADEDRICCTDYMHE